MTVLLWSPPQPMTEPECVGSGSHGDDGGPPALNGPRPFPPTAHTTPPALFAAKSTSVCTAMGYARSRRGKAPRKTRSAARGLPRSHGRGRVGTTGQSLRRQSRRRFRPRVERLELPGPLASRLSGTPRESAANNQDAAENYGHIACSTSSYRERRGRKTCRSRGSGIQANGGAG